MHFCLIFLCFAIVKAGVPPKIGTYEVKTGSIHVGGYVAGGTLIQTAQIWWPTPKSSTEKFPFIIFMHGMTDGGTGGPLKWYGPDLVKPLASFGFIVMAPDSCRTVYCEEFYKDGLHTLDTVQKNASLHHSLKTADLSKLGVFGHSMGGAATVYMANNKEFLGAVGLHPSTFLGDGSKGVKVPVWYATGSADTVVLPSEVISSYNKDPIKPKLIAEIKGANHHEPSTGQPNRWTPYVNQYMLCHVKGEKDACSYIYGSDDSSICGQKSFAMTKCTAEQ